MRPTWWEVVTAYKKKMVFQHDGCPAHYSRHVRDWLNNNHPNRWIGRGGPIPWPARQGGGGLDDDG